MSHGVVSLVGCALVVLGCKTAPKPALASEAPAASASAAPQQQSLPALRHALHTGVLVEADTTPAPEPPARLFSKVSYDAPLGKNVAYITPELKDAAAAKRPGVIWIHGGMDWGLSDFFWQEAPRENDQSAKALRQDGIVLMLPSLRGSNGNPGKNECFLGEVDDILAAAEYLARRPDVDPQRVYLAGHSTGATLALLTAESSQRFRAVVAFGAVADPRGYGSGGCLPEHISEQEARPRAPLDYISEITSPTFVIEGAQAGNAHALAQFAKRAGRAPLTLIKVPGASHFSVLAPGTEVLAAAILADTGPTSHLGLSTAQISARLAAAP